MTKTYDDAAPDDRCLLCRVRARLIGSYVCSRCRPPIHCGDETCTEAHP